MKRYTIIDNKLNKTQELSAFIWNFAWFLVFLCGVSTGISIITILLK